MRVSVLSLVQSAAWAASLAHAGKCSPGGALEVIAKHLRDAEYGLASNPAIYVEIADEPDLATQEETNA